MEEWNDCVLPKETELFILHPITGKRMDKAQCKRVITQMYGCIQDMDGLMKDRDRCYEMADKLADAIANHFYVDIGEHTSANHPWINALELIEPTGTRVRFYTDGIVCGFCGNPVSKNQNYCPNCGLRLGWSDK